MHSHHYSLDTTPNALIIRLVVKGQPPVTGCNQFKGETMIVKKLSVRDSSMADVSGHRDYLSSSLRAFFVVWRNDA